MIWLLCQSSQQEAVKQKEDINKELCCLRNELQQVRDGRDYALAQVQSLTLEIADYKEVTGKSSKDLEIITTRTIALEVSSHIFLGPISVGCIFSNCYFLLTFRRPVVLKENKYDYYSISLLLQMRNLRLLSPVLNSLTSCLSMTLFLLHVCYGRQRVLYVPLDLLFSPLVMLVSSIYIVYFFSKPI